MSSSTHHIQSTRYNRNQQNDPKSRIGLRDKVWLSYLNGRVQFGGAVVDSKSSVERREVRRRLKEDLLKDRLIALGGVAIVILLVGLGISVMI